MVYAYIVLCFQDLWPENEAQKGNLENDSSFVVAQFSLKLGIIKSTYISIMGDRITFGIFFKSIILNISQCRRLDFMVTLCPMDVLRLSFCTIDMYEHQLDK